MIVHDSVLPSSVVSSPDKAKLSPFSYCAKTKTSYVVRGVRWGRTAVVVAPGNAMET